MRGWSDEPQWVIDEDGLRWYFSERIQVARRVSSATAGFWDNQKARSTTARSRPCGSRHPPPLSGAWPICSSSPSGLPPPTRR